LRDIEETLDDPELQSQVARVREAARDIRREARKHAADPQWPLVQRLVAEPLEQIRQRVQEELLRKSAERSSIVPIDRDPVPGEFEKAQEKYYENLGSGSK
jgi:DNA-binding transcriptional regulator PaaX